jgi:hypothetical protein
MPVTQWVVEHAEGDGNCAFNAFILGLSEARILDHLPELGEANPDKRYALFIQRAQTVFTGTPLTWQKLRDALIRQKSNNRFNLQKTLAPVVRAFAIELIKKDPDSYYASTINPLKAELENYFNIKRQQAETFMNSVIDHNTPGMGDIFIRHDFVKKAFEFLWTNYGKSQGGLDKAQAALEAKWKDKGIELFLKDMNIESVYAGDLELAPLAKYFGINLDVDMGVRGHHSIVRFSRMPLWIRLEDNSEFKLDRNVCLKLSTRGIIDVERELEKISPEAVDARLSKIPDYDKVVAYINANKPVIGAPVPADWSAACLQQLLQRNIITLNKVFASDLSDEPVNKKANGKENREEALKRIAEFPHAKEIAAAWKAVPNAPVMTLKNSDAIHWDNIAVEALDLRALATQNFLYGQTALVAIDDILAARKMLEENHVNAKDASDALFAYARAFEKPEHAADRFNFAVYYHIMLGLYQYNPEANSKIITDFHALLRAELTALAKKFPAEFDLLSEQDDWEKSIKPCLDRKTSTKILTQKLDRLEKIFKEYDDQKWRAVVAGMHPGYVEAFTKLRFPKLSAGIASGSYGSPWHLWVQRREDQAKKTQPIVEQELSTPKYFR